MELARFALEQKAVKPVILDVKGKCGICDYFLICSGETGVQTQAICDEILLRCKEHNYTVHHYESDEQGRWILIDLFDIIVHIFTEEARVFYNLEYLWGQAKRVRPSRKKK
ncbi:MAG: ribosome silencing factor [Candidatus Omnitrophica bacterium]|nr:ribosome silencing factor [Candidatus Omnitrophota bacterium]